MGRTSTTSISTPPESQILFRYHPWEEREAKMMTCHYSSPKVSEICRKEPALQWLFSLVSGVGGFALCIFFLFFTDLLTPERVNKLIEKKLIGVRLRCQIGVIWFLLTPRPLYLSIFQKLLTPLIFNELSGFGVRRCQIAKSSSDTEQHTEYQSFVLCGVRSVRCFEEKSIVKQ